MKGPGRNVLGRAQRNVECQRLAAKHFQPGNLIAFLDRRDDRTLPDDAADKPLIGASRRHNPNGGVGHQRHRTHRAAEDACAAYNLALGEKRAMIERAQAPDKQLARFLGAVSTSLEAVDDNDESRADFNSLSDEAVA